MNDKLSQSLILVIPCYNEAERLNILEFKKFLKERPNYSFIFVNDGSEDNTQAVLDAFQRDLPNQVKVLQLPKNQGKAESVRIGILDALKMKPTYFGYWDADLDIPLDETEQFLTTAEKNPHAEVFIASRIPMLGRNIERKLSRQVMARMSATLIATVLKLNVYDSQCGAKIFRNSELCQELFDTPFISRWLFDVEIIARYRSKRMIPLGLSCPIVEIPLMSSTFSSKSKVGFFSYLFSLIDLFLIFSQYRKKKGYPKNFTKKETKKQKVA